VRKKVNRDRMGKVYHPLRERIVRATDASRTGIKSPNELAQALDEPLGNISYHVKELVKCGAMELVKVEPRRGAVEHFYRVTRGVLLNPQADKAALQKIAELVPPGTEGKGLVGLIAEELRAAGYEPGKGKIDDEGLEQAA
jgi:DNA-binding transcriptional ArsR family regulator